MEDRYKVLLIDDDSSNISFVRGILAKSQPIEYQLDEQRDLEKGIQSIIHNKPDVILINLLLNNTIGIDDLNHLLPYSKDIAVLVITTREHESLGMEALKRGAQDYLIAGEITPVLLVRSITFSVERKQAEKKLYYSEETNLALLNSIPDEGYLIDMDGKIIAINDNRARRIGRQPTDLIGVNVYNTLSPEAALKFKTRILEVKSSLKPLRYEEQRDGRYMSMVITPILDADGNIVRMTCLSRDMTEQRRAEEALRALSLTDELTGLYNRRGFATVGEHLVKYAFRKKRKMTLVFADLDNMRWINDVHGHSQGDNALKKTARVLRESFRESDILARWGGDEFAVLAVDTQEMNPDLLMSRLIVNISVENEGLDFKLSLSIGYSVFDPIYPCGLDQLIEQADQSMYKNKRWKPKL